MDEVVSLCLLRSSHVHAQLFSRVRLCDPMDCSPPGSSVQGLFRQGYQSGLPYPPPGDLPDLGIKLVSPASPALAGGFFTTSATWEAPSVSDCQSHCGIGCLIFLQTLLLSSLVALAGFYSHVSFQMKLYFSKRNKKNLYLFSILYLQQERFHLLCWQKCLYFPCIPQYILQTLSGTNKSAE